MTFAALHRFAVDRKGNVALIFGLGLIPVTFLAGLGMDYTKAARNKAILDAAADAAALVAVTPAMMASTDAASIAAAQNMFSSQASNVTGVSYSAANLTVTATDNALTRTVTVSYTASSQNAFGGLLGQTTWSISGTSQSTATVAPNIDFYLLLDNSPSMAMPATSAGVTTMVNATPSQGGCAIACHESNPSGDNLGNPGGEDNYALAKNLGVVTRIQNLASATQSLMSTATTTSATYNSSYRAGIYTFNTGGTNTIQTLTSNLATAGTAASAIDVLEVYDNNYLVKGTNNSDEDTDFETAMTDVNAVMPLPGTGMAGSTPQEVLFLVSDGVDDNKKSGSRNQAMFDTTYCTAVKNRGIRIAVLYTTYEPMTTNSWYNTYIAPFQPQIAGNMENCASPGLFFQVSTDQDISAAMTALFQQTIATARLIQ